MDIAEVQPKGACRMSLKMKLLRRRHTALTLSLSLKMKLLRRRHAALSLIQKLLQGAR